MRRIFGTKIKSIRLLAVAIMLFVTVMVWAGSPGVPFYRSVPSTEYGAHNRCYDLACDDYGTVFVANFEGLLYYDGATWRKVYTPGISRITRLARGKNGRIWFGGHDVFGYLTSDNQGRLRLKMIVSDVGKNKFSDVDLINVTPERVYVHTSAKKTYYVVNDKSLKLLKGDGEKMFTQAKDSINRYATLPFALQKQYKDIIQFVTHDRRHTLWGATDNGLFMVDTPSPYSKLAEGEGLMGEVNCIMQFCGRYYIGTMHGLYNIVNGQARAVPGINLACWEMRPIDGNRMLVASSQGLMIYNGSGVSKITGDNTLSVCQDTQLGGYITGETDGVYHVSASGAKTKISDVEKVVRLVYKPGKVTALNLYGEEWEITMNVVGGKITAKDRCVKRNIDQRKIMPSAAVQQWISPFTEKTLNCLYQSSDGVIAIGGEFGAYFIDTRLGAQMKKTPCQKPYIRQITILNDSVIWGGYTKGTMAPRSDMQDIELPYDCENITITYSSVSTCLASPTVYRYRIDGGSWSQWDMDHSLELHSISYHTTTIEIQARDIFGRVSPVSTVKWYKNVPFYLTWWAYLIYFILINFLIFKATRWRMRRLMRQKQQLEELVEERTADLKRTQADLVHMERRATASTLTQGLIDRILNPINYINNFSKMTFGLAKDLKEDIEDEKEHMTEDNYEDCEDILDMMRTNLTKIQEHGVSTTRTLRAMEAMLNNKVGQLVNQNIIPLCLQAVTVTRDYHKQIVSELGLQMNTEVPNEPVMVDMDAESINRAIIALLNNAVYSVSKKARSMGKDYQPEVKLTISSDSTITIRDNGIGIEASILDRVFDPFFTTKPTGEASGVGLYLVKNIITDHHGTITVASVKNEYCEFTIKL